ncbi:post-segregation antitoxin (ccd killing protein) [Crossiella equi]|uniref:Post-segregation antitoxin (Ccd killing protein) n=2 Tax=Crossiella equi TaxID=130796 RepID=A0ABS5A9R4_9PSEU|nr:hypothetical protein [Crossiella equi]MBP2473328.1 post-segregation antitoxin (ccd killing protein) [Crossiella equi]
MKWTRAVHHLETLAQTCADLVAKPNPVNPLRVPALWATGAILEAPHEIELIEVAVCVDLPAAEVPWLGEPKGAQHWANLTRMSRNPFQAHWRSARTPVWNHHILRPVLVFSEEHGVHEDALAALAEGKPEPVRAQAPSAEEYRARQAEELALAHTALREATEAYEARRWQPGKLEPFSDTLFRASAGYLDLLANQPA